MRCAIFGVLSPNFRTIAKREVCADAPCGLIFRPALSLSPKEFCNRRTKEKGISTIAPKFLFAAHQSLYIRLCLCALILFG
ncbi:hypothetical protein GCWU000325_00684 [Alloprevotella tannerae ATCC 51259]|uniref:Uncharacterized protein n=1 Tax=Alloprevotella tannerae ATCC 51259 TaxID=626522 RepID=C9LEQ4_9BACT|nr:hypothetical protein GCWU000325_00684 [Alloprevotella tannerae ATCC 51259]